MRHISRRHFIAGAEPTQFAVGGALPPQ